MSLRQLRNNVVEINSSHVLMTNANRDFFIALTHFIIFFVKLGRTRRFANGYEMIQEFVIYERCIHYRKIFLSFHDKPDI